MPKRYSNAAVMILLFTAVVALEHVAEREPPKVLGNVDQCFFNGTCMTCFGTSIGPFLPDGGGCGFGGGGTGGSGSSSAGIEPYSFSADGGASINVTIDRSGNIRIVDGGWLYINGGPVATNQVPETTYFSPDDTVANANAQIDSTGNLYVPRVQPFTAASPLVLAGSWNAASGADAQVEVGPLTTQSGGILFAVDNPIGTLKSYFDTNGSIGTTQISSYPGTQLSMYGTATSSVAIAVGAYNNMTSGNPFIVVNNASGSIVQDLAVDFGGNTAVAGKLQPGQGGNPPGTCNSLTEGSTWTKIGSGATATHNCICENMGSSTFQWCSWAAATAATLNCVGGTSTGCP